MRRWLGLEEGGAVGASEAGEDVIEQTLERLAEIEKERAACLAYLQQQQQLESRYEIAIQRKHRELREYAPDDAAALAIENAAAALHALQARLNEMDETLHCVLDAHEVLEALWAYLDDASDLSLVDIVDWAAPIEALLARAKYVRVRAARERGERARSALLKVGERLGIPMEAQRVAGPALPFNLEDHHMAIFDGVSNHGDGLVAYHVSKWRAAVADARRTITDIRVSLHVQRAALEREAAEARDAYRRLVVQA